MKLKDLSKKELRLLASEVGNLCLIPLSHELFEIDEFNIFQEAISEALKK